MPYYENPDVIHVTVKGSAETDFVSATFKASTSATGATGPEAKEKALRAIASIKSTVLREAGAGGIDTGRLKSSFSVDVHRNRNTDEFIGYRATYTIEFTGTAVAAAPAVHDALTSIEGVVSPTPVYNLDDSAEVHARAFKVAFDRATAKFEHQCRAVGLGPGDFAVRTWTLREEEPRGKSVSFREGATPEAVGIEPGKASLDMVVTFTYARRAGDVGPT